jgi:hypothetical protein
VTLHNAVLSSSDGGRRIGGVIGRMWVSNGGEANVSGVTISASSISGATDIGGVIGDAIIDANHSATLSAVSVVNTDVIRTDVNGAGGVIGAALIDGSLSLTDVVVDATVVGTSGISGGMGGVFGSLNANSSDSVVTLVDLVVDATVSATPGGTFLGGLVGSFQSQPGATLNVDRLVMSSHVSIQATGGAVGGLVGRAAIRGEFPIRQSSITAVAEGVTSVGGLFGSMSGGFSSDPLNLVLDDVQMDLTVTGTSDVECIGNIRSDESGAVVVTTGTTRATGTKTEAGVTTPCPTFGTESSNGSTNPPGLETDLTTPPTTSTPPTTVPPTTVPTVPQPVPTGGVLPTLQPGVSQVLVDGVPVSVEVFVEASTDLVMKGQDFELRLAGECTDGCSITTTADGRQVLELEERGLAKVSGEGFLAGTPVYVWLFSEPRFLGELTVNADGTFSGHRCRWAISHRVSTRCR